MSNICIEQNRVDEAIEYLEQILDEYPNDVGALNDLGYLLVDQRKCLERATEMIRIAVKAEPDNLAYRDSLGWALYQQGKHAEAIEHLKKAASAEPPDPIILDHLGDAYAKLGKYELATKTWRNAMTQLQDGDLTPADTNLKQSIQHKLSKPTELN
jgi:tetratricopeptide (TPR) repeat protein